MTFWALLEMTLRSRHTYRYDGLENIQFMDGLGSLKDKIEREANIAVKLLDLYNSQLKQQTGKSKIELEKLILKAVHLAKADLTSEMVYEFTELQGLMGYYYAKAEGKSDDEMIKVWISGNQLPLRVEVNETISNANKEQIEKNILEAIQKAHESSTTTMKERMNDLTGGLNLNLPGLDNNDS
jgi:DNA-binding protein YbaB